ncbi:hypothetical protein PIB30_030054 [Stylosanthes scabra]|uniref:Uncharacterized protein n=1 Tax=Stylosanthes scabra TaxID=79078 RepID=A0ABU6UDE8_9FABA|nr:hypothetical protein [Stylosanthes scabra]
MEEREKRRTTAPAKRKESRRAIVVKRERHEEREKRGGEEGRGSFRRRRHHSELLPPPKLPLSAPCLVAIAPSLLENRERTTGRGGSEIVVVRRDGDNAGVVLFILSGSSSPGSSFSAQHSPRRH